MKKHYILSLLCSLPLLLFANTFTDDVVLSSQAQVDNFKLITSSADTVTGFILIEGSDITNLDSLENLQRIDGSLAITGNPMLANVDGLQNLKSIGGFLSIGTNMLSNLSGLQNLQHIGGSLLIGSNDKLMNVDGLHNLKSIGGFLVVQRNSNLLNVDGLQNLQRIGGDLQIFFNDKLSACCGLLKVLDDIDDGELGPGTPPRPDIAGGILIFGNANGCNDQTEIINGGVCARILPTPPTLIPTMSQWGLLLFSLIVLTLGVVGIWNVSRVVNCKL